MKKDIIIALIVGFLIGAIVALIATHLPQIINEAAKSQSLNQIPTPTPEEVKTTVQNLDFTIISPKDDSIADSKTIDISGNAKSGQLILIETQDDHKTVEADSSGTFTAKLNISEGVNTIFFSSYDDTGNITTKSVNVYFTSEKL